MTMYVSLYRNVCWNNVIWRIFGFQRWESVKTVIWTWKVNVTYEFIVPRLKFYKRLYFISISFLVLYTMCSGHL